MNTASITIRTFDRVAIDGGSFRHRAGVSLHLRRLRGRGAYDVAAVDVEISDPSDEEDEGYCERTVYVSFLRGQVYLPRYEIVAAVEADAGDFGDDVDVGHLSDAWGRGCALGAGVEHTLR
jgi:hypothetical protein